VLTASGALPAHPPAEQEHANLPLSAQPLQIAVDRPEADARQRPAHTLIDLVGAGVRMVALQGVVHRRQLPGRAFVNFTDHGWASFVPPHTSAAKERRTAGGSTVRAW